MTENSKQPPPKNNEKYPSQLTVREVARTQKGNPLYDLAKILPDGRYADRVSDIAVFVLKWTLNFNYLSRYADIITHTNFCDNRLRSLAAAGSHFVITHMLSSFSCITVRVCDSCNRSVFQRAFSSFYVDGK